MRAARRAIIGVAAALVVAGVAVVGYVFPSDEERARQVEVAARGGEVMSFDLERTTHVFKTLDDGGVQTVLADDAGDAKQIRLIRSHLRGEAGAFERGVFDDPVRVHGEEMPGLADLKAGADRIAVRYEPIPDGGRIRYSTSSPELVAAIHEWFRAQVADHGQHAQGEL